MQEKTASTCWIQPHARVQAAQADIETTGVRNRANRGDPPPIMRRNTVTPVAEAHLGAGPLPEQSGSCRREGHRSRDTRQHAAAGRLQARPSTMPLHNGIRVRAQTKHQGSRFLQARPISHDEPAWKRCCVAEIDFQAGQRREQAPSDDQDHPPADTQLS